MSSSSASEPRTCPQCGARNSGLSLFCAECGVALYNDPSEQKPDDAAQTTSVFVSADDPNATAEFSPVPGSTQETMTSPSPWSEPVTDTTWSSGTVPPVEVAYTTPESLRGLVLGWIAAVVIALVVGFVIWSTLFSAGTRDTISGWFGWIG